MDRPILLTGSHRSGTTFVGNIIALSNQIIYLHEPFNKNKSDRMCGYYYNNFSYWFPYIDKSNEMVLKPDIQRMLELKFNYKDLIFSHKKFKKSLIRDYFRLLEARLLNKKPLIKDPIAVFSSEWFYNSFNTQNIVLVRNPLAFAGSLKKHNWTFSFQDIYRQSNLMTFFPEEYSEKIKYYSENPPGIIDQAILLWNIINYYIMIMINKYPDWLLIKHELLSKDPILYFEKIFNYCGLDLTQKIKNNIILSTSRDDSKIRFKHSGNHDVIRNSIENLDTWKKRLNNKEIDRIINETNTIYKFFYE